jgi:hypothetical protein
VIDSILISLILLVDILLLAKEWESLKLERKSYAIYAQYFRERAAWYSARRNNPRSARNRFSVAATSNSPGSTAPSTPTTLGPSIAIAEAAPIIEDDNELVRPEIPREADGLGGTLQPVGIDLRLTDDEIRDALTAQESQDGTTDSSPRE